MLNDQLLVWSGVDTIDFIACHITVMPLYFRSKFPQNFTRFSCCRLQFFGSKLSSSEDFAFDHKLWIAGSYFLRGIATAKRDKKRAKHRKNDFDWFHNFLI